MNLRDALALGESGLAVVGVVAIGVWMIGWVSRFTEKHKELAEVDKKTREALRHQVEVHADHAKLLEENYSREVRIFAERLKEAEQRLQHATVAERHLALVRAAADMASQIQGEAARKGTLRLRAAYMAVSVAWLEQIGSGQPVGPLPPDQALKRANGLLDELGHASGFVSAGAKILGVIVPAALDVLDRKPDASGEEVRMAVVSAIRKELLPEKDPSELWPPPAE